MQNEFEKKEIENVEANQPEAGAEQFGLEVVEDTPQISLVRPVRHIRR
ncbi:hypothetical protein [Trinickia violacea]|nr:hypothetical protein [Trinickia violacea]